MLEEGFDDTAFSNKEAESLQKVKLGMKNEDIHIGIALNFAARYDLDKLIDFLLQHRIDIDLPDSRDLTVLHCAPISPRNNINIVEQSIKGKARVNVHCERYGSALQAAAFQGKAVVVKVLLENGAVVDYSEREYGSALLCSENRTSETREQ